MFGIEDCHRDPAVEKYGLVNALMPIGTSFLEVVSPSQPDTAAGRHLERRGGDGGYMVICDCDNNRPFRDRALSLGIRLIEDRRDAALADLLQLHPRDTGGCILEFDRHTGGELTGGNYRWAGHDWQRHVRTGRVEAIVGVEVQSDARDELARRWSLIIGRDIRPADDGHLSIRLNDGVIRFVAAKDGRGEGLSAIHLGGCAPDEIMSTAEKRGMPVRRDVPRVTVGGVQFLL